MMSDRLHLGWQYATPHPDPGPSPRRPTPPDAERPNPEWAAAQRREEKSLNRPLRAATAGAVLIGLVLFALGATGQLNVVVAGLGVVCCALVAGVSGYAIWQGERALRSRLADERARVNQARAAQESQLFAWQEEHARRLREWQALLVAYEHQKRWYAVGMPDGIQRVDVVGGTLSGWSALLATAGGYRLAAGGEVTVIDLSDGPVALDLLGFARARGIEPVVWVLPDDLARLDLSRGLGRDALAEALSLAVSGTEEDQASSISNAILERVIDVLGGTATIASIAAALRALARVGDPQDDVASGLISAAQVDRLGVMFGRGAGDRAVIERAWVLESQLRKLAAVGTDPADLMGSALRVVALSQRTSAADARLLGTYLAATLTHALRGRPPGKPWQHTLFVLGADRFRGEVLDRLCGACESTGTGLVLAFRAIPPRPGRGSAAVAFMRAQSAEDAKTASEQIGADRPLVLSQLTETIGPSVSDIAASRYTSTAGSVAAAPSAAAAPDSTGEAGSADAGLAANTAWGTATAKAAEEGEPAMLRSRELVVDQQELQQLPPSAMIITYQGQVVLADANPGIGGLPAATEETLEEYRVTPAAGENGRSETADGPRARTAGSRARPNVGPPPPRLDWRRRRP